jgi:hypothetical protein
MAIDRNSLVVCSLKSREDEEENEEEEDLRQRAQRTERKSRKKPEVGKRHFWPKHVGS